jgi:hypothetical protein
MNKIAFSVDLDDWYHTPLVSGASFSRYTNTDAFFKNWKGRFDYITDPALKMLDLLDSKGIKATFFVIADMVERYPILMRKLKESEHEIAHHSLHHTIPFDTKTKQLTQSKENWEMELLEAKEILEKYFEREIIGYRAPGAYFAEWMIPLLKKNDFKYDSSIAYNSIYNKSNLEIKNSSRNCFRMNNKGVLSKEEGDLFEIPWPYLKIGNIALPGGGAFFFRFFGYHYFKRLLKQTLRTGSTMFYIHPLDISNERFPLPNFKYRPFYWINKGDKTLKKLKKLLEYFENLYCPMEKLSEMCI